MITTSQSWKDNQNKQIRAECDVRLTFFKTKIIQEEIGGQTYYFLTYEQDAVLTKKQISNFKYSQNGTLANEVLPFANINFSCIKVNNQYDFDEKGYCKFEVGYYLPNSPNADANGWEWIVRGYFMIKNKEIPANGLVAKYQLISCRDSGYGYNKYKNIEENYTWGSYYHGLIGTPERFTTLYIIQNILGGTGGSGTYYQVGGALPVVSYVELARQVAITDGSTFYIGSNGKFCFKKFSNNSQINYLINRKNLLNKPEKSAKNSNSIKFIANNTSFDDFKNYTEQSFTTTSSNEWVDVECGRYQHYEIVGGASGNVIQNKIYINRPAGTYTVKLYPFNIRNSFFEIKLNQTEQIENEPDTKVEINTLLMDDIAFRYDMPSYFEYIFNNNTFYEFNCRIDPSLELFDLIALEMPDDTFVTGFIENIEFSYNGAFKGKIKIRKANDISIPLIFTVKGNGTFKFVSNATPQHTLEYVKGENSSWTTYTPGTEISVSENDVIAFRGVNPNGISTSMNVRRGYFSCTVPVEIDGDIMSLIDKTGQTKTVPSEACFNELFSELHIQKINPRVFSPTTLTNYAFYCLCGSNGNTFLQDYTEPIFWKVKQKNLLGGCFQRIFGGTYVPITLDLTDVEEIHTATGTGSAYGSLCVSSSVAGTTGDVNWTFIFGNELTSLDSNYYANGTPNSTSAKYLTLKFPKYLPADVPAFDINNLIIEGGIKGSKTITVFADNKIIADSCQLKKGLYTTVNIYHNDGTSWEALSYLTLAREGNCTLVFDDVPNAQRYELLRKVGSRYEVISQITSPTDLNSYFDNSGAFTTETIYVRAVTGDTSKLNSSNSSLQIYHGGGSATAYWYVGTTAPIISVSSNILSISGAGGTPNKYFIFVDSLLKLETTSTSVDLTTLPNVSTGSHQITVCAHYSESSYNYLGNMSTVSWTKS